MYSTKSLYRWLAYQGASDHQLQKMWKLKVTDYSLDTGRQMGAARSVLNNKKISSFVSLSYGKICLVSYKGGNAMGFFSYISIPMIYLGVSFDASG